MEQTMTPKQKEINTSKVICESKKHFFANFFPIFLIIVGAFFGIAFFYEASFMGLVGIIMIAFGIHKILLNKTTRWILYEDELIITSGFLPWQRIFFTIPIDNIFEAFYQHDFFAHLFKYGHLNIRRTEGSTSSFRTTAMIKNKEMTGTINSMVRNLKTNPVQKNPLNQNLSDELLKLANLKNQGILTEEEFQLQKQKMLSN